MKIAKLKILHYCELGKADINNMSLTSEIVHDYQRGNLKSVTSLPEFMTDSVYLMNHSEVQKKKVQIQNFNTQDKELLLVLENLPEDDNSLNFHNVSTSNKAIEKERIREGVENSKKNTFHIQDSEHLNLKLTTSPSMLIWILLVQSIILTSRQVMLGIRFLTHRAENSFLH